MRTLAPWVWLQLWHHTRSGPSRWPSRSSPTGTINSSSDPQSNLYLNTTMYLSPSVFRP